LIVLLHLELILYLLANLLILTANLIKYLAGLPNETLIRGCLRRGLLCVISLVCSGVHSALHGDPEVGGVAPHYHRHNLRVSEFTASEVKVLQWASSLLESRLGVLLVPSFPEVFLAEDLLCAAIVLNLDSCMSTLFPFSIT
jgi:hypothetical protein